MKVILSGATGFIGGEVLSQALAHPSITSLVCLTRRALPESISNDPKLQVITITDFTNYPPEVLKQLQDSDACIWAMGSPAYKSPLAESKKVEIEYTLTAANAFAQSCAQAKEKGKGFRFLYLSGMGANRDTNKNLWFLKNVRNIKGEVENSLLEIAAKKDLNFDVTIVRPGGVLAKGSYLPDLLVAASMSIRLEELGAAMVNEVVGEVEGSKTLECGALRNEGRELLRNKVETSS